MIWTLEGQVACWKLVNDNGKVLLGVSVCLVHWNNPLQCSCLENPRDGGAWWAAVYGVTQSRTWLSNFTSLHWGSRGQLWPTAGTMTLVHRPQGMFISMSSPRGHPEGTKIWPYQAACRFHCWDASGQTTNRVGTEPHLLTDRLLKVIMSSRPPPDALEPVLRNQRSQCNEKPAHHS